MTSDPFENAASADDNIHFGEDNNPDVSNETPRNNASPSAGHRN